MDGTIRLPAGPDDVTRHVSMLARDGPGGSHRPEGGTAVLTTRP
jgi:hypothetical protein